MIVSLIAAMSTNRVIGKGDKMPWHLPDDLRYFLDTTRHHPVLIGRTTYLAYQKVMRHHRMFVVTSKESLPGGYITLPMIGMRGHLITWCWSGPPRLRRRRTRTYNNSGYGGQRISWFFFRI